MVRDELISHDVRLRRVVGAEQRKYDRKAAEFERRVVALLNEIDPAGAPIEAKRMIRLARFEKRLQELAREFYGPHATEFNETLRGIARAESQAVTGALDDVAGDLS